VVASLTEQRLKMMHSNHGLSVQGPQGPLNASSESPNTSGSPDGAGIDIGIEMMSANDPA